jgi:hypothetical protein
MATEAEIRASYATQIQQAQAEQGLDEGARELAVLRLSAKMNGEIVESYQAVERQRAASELKVKVLGDFPKARADEVRGETEEELRAAAQASHAHYEAALEAERAAIRAQLENELGGRSYGRPTAGGASGTNPTIPSEDPADASQAALDKLIAEGKPISEEMFVQNLGLRLDRIGATTALRKSILESPGIQNRLRQQIAQLQGMLPGGDEA